MKGDLAYVLTLSPMGYEISMCKGRGGGRNLPLKFLCSETNKNRIKSMKIAMEHHFTILLMKKEKRRGGGETGP